MNRSESILHGLALETSKILEIGPLYKPLLWKGVHDVYYLDHLNTSELRAKYKDDPSVPAEAIIDVDFVQTGRNLAEAAAPRGPYDIVVASHVIEHVPDLVHWLWSIGEVLKPGGTLCLAVPDKRFTFDMLRRLTTIKDIDEAWAERRWRPPLDIVCDSYRNSVGMEASAVWNGTLDSDAIAIGWPAEIVNRWIERHQNNEYVDVHCWVFTPWSFLALIGKIAAKYQLPLGLRYFWNTQPYEEEFHVQLAWNTASPLGTDWTAAANSALATASWPTHVLRTAGLAGVY